MRFCDRLLFYREHMLGLKGTAGRQVFADKIGKSVKTLERWESKKGHHLPNSTALAKIINQFPDNNVDMNWLLTGKGEPFPGARAQFPEVCGDLIYKDTERVNGALPVSGPTPGYTGKPEDTEIKVSDALTMTARVLESGTSYATALYLNIVHFDQAIQAEKRITKLEIECDELKERLSALEEKIKEDLKSRKEALKASAAT